MDGSDLKIKSLETRVELVVLKTYLVSVEQEMRDDDLIIIKYNYPCILIE